jgi:hypothetical protein
MKGNNYKLIKYVLVKTINALPYLLNYLAEILITAVSFFAAIFARSKVKLGEKPRIVWGSTPLINNSYWSKALREIGYCSETFTTEYYSTINQREDFDILLTEKFKNYPEVLKPYLAFIESLFCYDLFVISCDGFFLGRTPFKRIQATLFKIANKKVIVVPYGSDAFVYGRIRSIGLMHGLMMSYPGAAKDQKRIGEDLDYWVKHADVVLPGWMGPDGWGRWSISAPSILCLNLDIWKAKIMTGMEADGRNGKVVIAHAPNHRGFKGTEFVIEAVDLLKDEGLQVELLLIEKMQNSEVRKCLQFDTDILVDQLISPGHGLNALEGLASGLPVLCNLEDESYVLQFRRWSFLNECPLVSASPENLRDVLRKLVVSPELRRKLGDDGRKYVEKYHGYESTQYLFTKIIESMYNNDSESLIDLYHPLKGEYNKRKPKIIPPLVNSRIVD